jgi:tetratricopeptide (TPR) repeat protein
MKLQTLALALALVVGGSVHAQSLPKPAEFYFDADASAQRPVVAVRETGDEAIERLLKIIKRNPRAAAERAQLAQIAMDGGRPELGRELYEAALGQLDSNSSWWRAVRWNYGWGLYRSGAYADALAQWATLVSSTRATTASWMPPTFALVLWQLGRHEEALQWYAAAVRSEPQQWRTSEQFATLLPDWRDEERATLEQVQQAWAANPPSWP